MSNKTACEISTKTRHSTVNTVLLLLLLKRQKYINYIQRKYITVFYKTRVKIIYNNVHVYQDSKSHFCFEHRFFSLFAKVEQEWLHCRFSVSVRKNKNETNADLKRSVRSSFDCPSPSLGTEVLLSWENFRLSWENC